jgi:opine dehydrogenase
MRIAVLGGGHGAYAAAADLADQGHEVRLWRRDSAAFAPVLESGAIRLKDVKGARSVRLAAATTDIGAALGGASLVLIPAPATAQADIARAMAPHLERAQVVFSPPGTFGSYAMAAIARAPDVAFAETGTLPYLARKHAPDEIAITMRARRLPVGVFPARRTDEAMKVISAAYPVVHPVEDALSAALMNAGPIIHPPLILMNAGPLEHSGRYDIHNEGTQPAIRRVTDALDEERIALREALGYAPYHYPLRDHYTSERWMYGDAHDRLTESGDWREHIDLRSHRYMREDVAYGLALLVSLGRWAGVATPLAAGLLAIASAALGEDLYGASPRTLEALRLSRLDRPAMKKLLQEGISA